MPHWEHFHHQADIGVRGRGHSLASAFEQAALALTAVIADPAQLADLIPVSIECEAPDSELLLTDWLNALVYQMATRHMLFSRFSVLIDDNRLHATAWGEPVDRSRHQPGVEVKGATYTALKVSQDAHGDWTAECVVDV
ncbi:MAG: archease [Chromatiales bacterium]|jgi:tRNA nucleotidyltransferase (CCA-adding enzyme)